MHCRRRIQETKAQLRDTNFTNPAYHTSRTLSHPDDPSLLQALNHGNRLSTLGPPLTNIDENGYAAVIKSERKPSCDDINSNSAEQNTQKREGYLTMDRGSKQSILSISSNVPPLPLQPDNQNRGERSSVQYTEMDKSSTLYSEPLPVILNPTAPSSKSPRSSLLYDTPQDVKPSSSPSCRGSAIYGEIDDDILNVTDDKTNLMVIEEDYTYALPQTDAGTLTPGAIPPPAGSQARENSRSSTDAEDEGVYSLAEDVVDGLVLVENDLYIPSE